MWRTREDLPTPVYWKHRINSGLRSTKLQYFSYYQNSEPEESLVSTWRTHAIVILAHRGRIWMTSLLVGWSFSDVSEVETDCSACWSRTQRLFLVGNIDPYLSGCLSGKYNHNLDAVMRFVVFCIIGWVHYRGGSTVHSYFTLFCIRCMEYVSQIEMNVFMANLSKSFSVP
jgi:hypothetical protein